jgi:hypothetical protein
MPPGVDLLEAEEGLPILETALIARKLRPVFLSHEGGPISAEQGIREAGFLRPPALAFFPRDDGSSCWSRHHSMREMMLLGSNIMVSSCPQRFALSTLSEMGEYTILCIPRI